MRALIKRFATPLFFTVMFLYIVGGILNNQTLQLATKPLLIPVLIAFLLSSTYSSRPRNLLGVALLFSFLGDVFLLFEYKNPALFIPGLLSFLFTHILYIVYFISIKPARPSLLKTAGWLWPAVLLYAAGLLYLLLPKLGNLTIPVFVYAVVIISMVLASLHVYKRVTPTTGKLFITGAIFFVISDSLLAINKFYSPIHFSFLIILTYCIAQYLLVKGFTYQLRK